MTGHLLDVGNCQRGPVNGDQPHDVVNYLHSVDRLKIRFGVQDGTLDQIRILVAAERQ